MCRILGSFAAGADRPEPAQLAAVSARQRHGGPDEHQVLSGPGWSLGCDRLAVTDPCGGQQPYRLPHLPGVLAVLNGEIYNHAELRRTLAARGHRFPDRCDGTVLPALYAEYGPAFAEHLDGMFAVAVLDLRPGSAQLVLAVDDMGMKPLHLHHDPYDGSTRFASEIPALLAFEGVRISPREDALDTVLATRTSFSTHTALDGVDVLPPGATALVRPGCAPVVRRRGPYRATPLGDTQDVLRHEVRRLAQAEVPVCAVTSGGLDSGLVTALAAEHARETDAPPLHTFHLTYRGRWPDSEAAYARSVARRARTVHHEVAVDPDELGSLLTRTVRHLGQPNADPITLSTYALFRAVRENGFTVALAGDGADELFGGYDRMRAALTAGPDWAAAYTDALSAAPRLLREHLYTSHYRAYIADQGSAADRIEQELRSAEVVGADRLTAMTAFETRWRLPAYHLRRLDHLSMAWAVEARLPFCQPSVVTHARSLPTAARTGKRALYEAGAELLPAAVLRRPKQPFTLPVAAMLAPGGPLLDLVREMLSPARLVLGGKIRADRAAKLLARHLEHPTPQAALTLWSLAVHELWTEVVQGMRIPVGCAA
ncbi:MULTISPECIES: asparagine synthase (glutamine-hydrolyzing) [Streptomyces]|jgi:asparagine synthase (glutamine-hydrolysing)|uniref:asparagine synthase (glutamine-hydrolyzing) n=1 Tax=Streptomyces nymphaeiformis TaxID=2663842 RepID=A0A7W7U757_9ACTN|nr:asparagine synthase (glutamine-hydrolyzing) [Streptomyces nymphaeiformis]MBB4986241.1 asparagine synthase (glutamine-hydrolyzing) [Streptomyces nymphaeiformis]